MPSVGTPDGTSARRNRLALAVALTGLACLVIGAGVLAWADQRLPTSASATPGRTVDPADTSPTMTGTANSGSLITQAELRDRAQLARDGSEPYGTAVEQLIEEADLALDREPEPRNPLTEREGRFLEDTQDAYTLALAWTVSGDDRYARRSADFIMAWVDQVDRTTDTCIDDGGRDCATSLLVSRCAPAFVFAAEQLEGSGALSSEDVQRLKDWLKGVILPAASERTNNWGDAGAFMRLAVADYVGDNTTFMAATEQWRELMDLVTAEGQIPEETRRGSLGLLYTQGAISYKVAAAVIADRRGVDLWNYEGTNGGSLRAAVDTLAHYWENPRSWPWHHRKPDMPSVDPAWELIYQHWPDPAFARILGPKRPFGAANPSAIIWTTLTHGEPLDDAGAAMLPVIRPSDRPTIEGRDLPG